MPSADDISRTIEPGSLDQGDRQAFAANLQQALGPQGEPPAGGPGPQSGPAPTEVGDPLDHLLSGGHSTDLPVTSGLSVGPGNGPAGVGDTFRQSPMMDKLRVIASQASSPVLRKQARDALRREIRRGL